MRGSIKTALAALVLAGGAAIAVPASAQSFGFGIGPNGGIDFSYDSGGYCDEWGCPDDFWDMPVYYGPVFWGGYWYDGPLYYRDWYGAREYWIHGGWRTDEWRGPRPGWWRPGRLGPALGTEFYRSHGFHGRWDDRRGFDNRRYDRDDPRFDNRDNRGFDGRRDFNNRPEVNRQGFNRPDVDRSDANRPDFNRGDRHDRNDFNRNAAPQVQQQPPQQQQNGGFQSRRGQALQENVERDRQRREQQAAPQQQQQPQPQPQQNGNGGDDHRGHGRDRDNH